MAHVKLTAEQFLKMFWPVAFATEQATGLPRYYLLAMHVSEQGLVADPPGNMCFGIKAGPTWQGKRQLLPTWEVFDSPHVKWPHQVIRITPRSDGKYRYDLYDEFRAYDSIGDCYADHAAFLRHNPRYHAAWAYAGAGHDEQFTQAVIAAGYSTDPGKIKIMLDTIAWLKKKSSDYGLS